MIENGDLVKIDNGVQLMRNGDDGVFCEFLPYDALDHRVGNVIDARRGGLAWMKVMMRAERVCGDDGIMWKI